MAREDSCRRLNTAPSFTTVLPQMPMRCPPGTVKKPLLIRSMAVWAEARVAISTTSSRSAGRTGSPPGRGRSPVGHTTAMGLPARSRSSSATV